MFGSSRAAAGGVEARAIGSVPWGTWGDEGGTNTAAGARVTVRSSIECSLAVNGCARFIADGISTLPVDVFRGQGRDRQAMPKPRWLEEPTADLSFTDWAGQMLVSALTDGNALARKVFDSSGTLTELDPFDPETISVRRDRGRRAYFVNGRQVDSNEVLHIPGIMFPGADVGLSPVEAARQTIGRTVAVEDFAGKFFSQGANLSGVIEDPGPLDPVKARETARIWARLHSGNRRAHLPGVLQGGAVWKPTGVTNEQAQFLETHQFTQAQIAAFMFLIDPSEFGLSLPGGSSLTYANLVQRNQRKVQVTFLPWIVRLERALSKLLPQPRYMKLNVDGLLRAEAKTRFEMYEIASRINTAAQQQGMPPFMATDEMRDFEDWSPTDFQFPPAAAPAPAVPAQPDLELIQGAK
jgi:HK97 family phage portal protein